MKRLNKFTVALLSVFALAVLLSLPIGFLMNDVTSVSASTSGKTISKVSENDDYIFVVLNDDPVALAATPIKSSNIKTVGLVVLLSLLLMSVVSYTSWYLMVIRNIHNYSDILPKNEIKSLVPEKSFIHPLELSSAEYEIQYRAAEKFV